VGDLYEQLELDRQLVPSAHAEPVLGRPRGSSRGPLQRQTGWRRWQSAANSSPAGFPC